MPFVIPAPQTTFAGGVAASLASWNDSQGNWQALNAALAAMFEQTYGIVSAQGSPDSPGSYAAGYSTLLDPVNCPAQFLPYLSQFNGTGVQPGTDAATARSIITSEAGFSRGTPAAITAACKRFLTGTQSVFLLERTPGPYGLTIVVKPGELTSLSGLTAAVNAVKPAGIAVTVVVTDQWTWNQAVNTWSADSMTWNATASQQP